MQWIQLDEQLIHRTSLLAGFIQTVKGYISYEKSIFGELVFALSAFKAAASPSQTLTASDRLSGLIPGLFAVAETYPDLNADSIFIEQQHSLKEMEEKITYARQF